MKFDNLLKFVGNFGCYQKTIILTICIANVPGAFHQIGQVFFAATVDFWCTTPEFEALECPSPWNLTVNECQKAKTSFLVPSDGDNCVRFLNATTDSFINEKEPTNSWPVGRCDYWSYDTSQYKSTIIQEWNLVCDDKTKPAIAQSLFFVGVLVGSVVVGTLADRYGRKPMFFISILVQSISGFSASFSPNFLAYVCLRCIAAVCNFGVFTLCYVIGTEWVGPSHRKFVAIYLSVMWATGYIILAALAYFIPTWRTLSIVISLSGLLLLIFYPFTPESARWLMSQGRVDETLKALEKAAKANGKVLPDSIYDKDTLTNVDEEEKATILELFRTPNLRKNTLIMMFNWFVVACAYYGLSLGTSDLGVNDYLAFWVSGVVEIPACLLAMLLVDKTGRRWSLCGAFVFGGVACILTIWTPNGVWKITTAMTGKFSATFGFAVVYLFAAEIFPTPVRSIGVGISSTSAIVGGVLSPLLLELKTLWEPLPLLCFGSLTIIGGCLTLQLPETAGKQLPETIQQGENFGRIIKRFKNEDNLDTNTEEKMAALKNCL